MELKLYHTAQYKSNSHARQLSRFGTGPVGPSRPTRGGRHLAVRKAGDVVGILSLSDLAPYLKRWSEQELPLP